MFQTICKTIPKDPDYPERVHCHEVMTRILDGRFYDNLQHSFHEEIDVSNKYIPLRSRRPCTKYNLSATVVDDSVSLLFSEGHFPDIDCIEPTTRNSLIALAKESHLNGVMVDAAIKGSVGSIAILFQILNNRVYFRVYSTQYLTPVWDKNAPDTLAACAEQYKLNGECLIAAGYVIAKEDLKSIFWFRREWTKDAEVWFAPLKVSDLKDGKPFVADDKNTVKHNLGFVPMVWVKNLPGGNDIDGACTFSRAIDNQIEIDYQLSQDGRALKYAGDPIKVIKDDEGRESVQIIGAANAIKVSQEGDVKLLEITGNASAAVIEYVRTLREFALEAIHGNKANADKLSAAQSGRSMELMNQPLVWLADRLRISYGEGALIDLLRMVVKANQKFKLIIAGEPVAIGTLTEKANVLLRWPAWYQPTPTDRQSTATALDTHVKGGIMSEETATKAIAADYDIEDIPGERAACESDKQANMKMEKELMPKPVQPVSNKTTQ